MNISYIIDNRKDVRNKHMISLFDRKENENFDEVCDASVNNNGNLNIVLDGTYVFCKKKNIPSKGRVLHKLGLKKGSYMWNVTARFYDYFFDNLINFRKEYRRFYKREFLDCAEFIEEKYNFPKVDAQRYANENYWFKDLDKNVERNISTLNMDYRFANKFWKLIGGYFNENSDGLYY